MYGRTPRTYIYIYSLIRILSYITIFWFDLLNNLFDILSTHLAITKKYYILIPSFCFCTAPTCTAEAREAVVVVLVVVVVAVVVVVVVEPQLHHRHRCFHHSSSPSSTLLCVSSTLSSTGKDSQESHTSDQGPQARKQVPKRWKRNSTEKGIASKRASKPASKQAGKPASQQAGKPASKQASQQAGKPASKQASQQASKPASRQAIKQASQPASQQAS